MNYVKIETSDGDVRWVNLAQVRRVTLSKETSGEPLLVIMLDDVREDQLRIHGSDDTNRLAIEKVISRLDRLDASS